MDEMQLTKLERNQLAIVEQTIERCLHAFAEAATALLVVRECRLYRETHATFESYCRERWGMGKSRVYQIIDAAAVLDNLQKSTAVELPTYERQVRPLTKFVPEAQVEVWQSAVQSSQSGTPTTADVQAAADDYSEKEILEAAKRIRQGRIEKRTEDKKREAASLPDATYNVVYADPPWQYSNTGLNGTAVRHYPTMALDELCALPQTIGLQVAPNAVLFLWATNPLLEDALTLIHAWGFEYKTNIVWVKGRVGTGFYVRSSHELLMIATRGSFTPIETNHAPPITSVMDAVATEHSRKPEQGYELIESLYPDCNYIELFARRSRDGWHSFGNEVNDASDG